MPAARLLLSRRLFFSLIALGVLSYSAIAQNSNPWTFDKGLKETTGLCTTSSLQSGLQIQLTRQDNIDVGMTIDFAPAVRPSTPQVTIVYANGQSIKYSTVETGPSRLTLLPGAADGFSGPLKSTDGEMRIILPQQIITITSAQTALLIAAIEDCAGVPLPVPSPLTPTELISETPNPIAKEPEPAPAPESEINDRTAGMNAKPEEPPTAEAPVTGLIRRHMDESDDGGLERKLLEEWAEKMNLLEKENIALRDKVKAENSADKLQDLRTDPMAKIREDALRRKVEELQEEVQKTRAEAQKIAAEKEALIDAQPPPLPAEENQVEDLPPVIDTPAQEEKPQPVVPSFGPPPAPPKLFTVPKPPVKAEESTIPAISVFGPPSP